MSGQMQRAGGAGIQYTAGDVSASPTGDVVLFQGAANTITAVSAANPLPVTVTGAGAGGTSMTDDAAFTVGTTGITPAGGTYRAARDSVNDGDGGAFAMTASRALFTSLETPNGDSVMNDTLDFVKVGIVDGAGAQITSFGGGTQFADGAARSTATGTISMVDDGTNIQSMRGDSLGRPLVTIDTALPTGTAVIGRVAIDQTTPGTTNLVDTELPTAALLADAAATPTTPMVGAVAMLRNTAGTIDFFRGAQNALNSAGTGIAMAGNTAQFDDVSPTAITENQWGNLRISANRNLYNTIRDAAGNERGANVTAASALVVDGSAVTQPISVASLPLPAGAATSAAQTTSNSSLSSIDGKITAVNTGAVVVASSALPTGAATETTLAARIPANGQALMAASVPVVLASDQSSIPVSLASTTVTGSVAVTGPLTDTQLRAAVVPISGTVTANAGTNLNTSALALDATLTDGTQKALQRGVAKGATAAGDITSTNQSADRQAMDVQIRTSAGAVIDSFGGGSQYAEDAVAASGDIMTVAGVVRQDTLASSTSADGDYTTLKTNSIGALYTIGATPTALTASAPTASSVGVTSATALASNANRRGLQLINTSNGNISISFGGTAVLNSGITLYPGGVFEMTDRYFHTGAVAAIAALAASNLAIQEWT